MHQEQLAAQQRRLRLLNLQHDELVRQSALLDRADRFARRARALGLQRENWTSYDVNVQSPLSYEAAQEMIYQCSDSDLAYFWPISLEIKAPEKEQGGRPHVATSGAGATDVILSVKGRFVAR